MTEGAAGRIEEGGGHDREGGLLSWGGHSGRRLTENRQFLYFNNRFQNRCNQQRKSYLLLPVYKKCAKHPSRSRFSK